MKQYKCFQTNCKNKAIKFICGWPVCLKNHSIYFYSLMGMIKAPSSRQLENLEIKEGGK